MQARPPDLLFDLMLQALELPGKHVLALVTPGM